HRPPTDTSHTPRHPPQDRRRGRLRRGGIAGRRLTRTLTAVAAAIAVAGAVALVAMPIAIAAALTVPMPIPAIAVAVTIPPSIPALHRGIGSHCADAGQSWRRVVDARTADLGDRLGQLAGILPDADGVFRRCRFGAGHLHARYQQQQLELPVRAAAHDFADGA